MKKAKHDMLKIIIKGLIKEGYGINKIYSILLDLGSAYRFERFLDDYLIIKRKIDKEEGIK